MIKVNVKDIKFLPFYDDIKEGHFGVCRWHHPFKPFSITSKIFRLNMDVDLYPDEFIEHRKKLLKSYIDLDPKKFNI